MFFQVKHSRRTGLQLIKHLEVGALSRLEGYNGIGKSALVRLIQVCVGQHPYPFEPSLWESFRDGVGTARVILTGIDGAESIEWILDAANWEAENETVTNLGEIRIDGNERTLDDVQQLLDVRTILGNEGLTGTLARRFARYRDGVHEVATVGSPLQQRLDELDELLRPAESCLTDAVSKDIAKAAADESAARSKLDTAKQEADTAEKRLAAVATANSIAARLGEIEGKGDDLASQIEVLDTKIGEIEGRLSVLDGEIAAASADTAAAKEAQRKLRNAQAYASRMAQKFDDAAMEVVRLSGETGIQKATNARVTEQRTETQRELESLTSKLTLIHSAPEVADVADDLIERLSVAEEAGLSNDIIVDDKEMDTAYSVIQLREVLNEQSRRLRSLPPPDEAGDIQAQIARFRQQFARLDRLAKAISDRRNAEDKVKASRERLDAALEELADASTRDMDDLVEQRKTLTKQLQEAAVERADLIRARAELGGGATPEELQAQLTHLLNDLDLQPEDVASVLQAAAASSESAQGAVETLTTEYRTAAQSLRATRQELAEVAALLAGDPKFAWVRASASHLVPPAGADPAVQVRLLEELQSAIQMMRDRITGVRHQLSAADQSFQNAYNQLRQNFGQTDETRGIRSWFGEEVSDWFNLPQLLETVFEHSDHVRVDLNEMAVQWEMDGEAVSRPLGAFSSGQRAFAYTRAQLALIDSSPSPANRLIVLDEFGAFIARDWQHRLEQYLRDRARDNPRNRTLLILPLTQTIEDLQAGGRADDELAQLRDMPGYYTRNLLSDNAHD